MPEYSGLTATTPEKLLLDAGAFFKNFIVGTDTYTSAVSAGKLLGATMGGGNFSAIPTMRRIEVDGAKSPTKGLQTIDEWIVTIVANVKEISEDVLVAALATGSAVDGPVGYRKITASNDVLAANYIDNITWVGRLSGSNIPVIIVVKNALSTAGLTLTMADKAEAVAPITFTGHFDAAALDEPPFEIYYPTADVVNGSITGVVSNVGGVVEAATVTVTVGNLAITTLTNASGAYTLANVKAGTYTVSAYKDAQVGAVTNVVVVAGVATANVNITIA